MLRDETVETCLAAIAAFIYEDRSGDKVGAEYLRRTRAPGSGVDIAPTRRIDEAAAHSKMELQVQDRVARLRRADGGKDKGTGKNTGERDGKGKGKSNS